MSIWSLECLKTDQIRYSFQGRKERELVAKRILAKQRTDKINFELEGKPYYCTMEERRHNLKGDKDTWFRQMGATTP